MAKVRVSLLALVHLVNELRPGYNFMEPDVFEELYHRLDAWVEDGQGRNGQSARAVYAASRLGLTAASLPRTVAPKRGLPTTLCRIPECVVRAP